MTSQHCKPRQRSISPSCGTLLVALGCLAPAVQHCRGGDLAQVSLFNGERTGVLNSTVDLNNWGGQFHAGSVASISRDVTVARTGTASVRADLGTIPAAGSKFFQTFASELGAQAFRQTRDLTRYEDFSFYVRNDTAVPLTLKFEIKDYRDSGAQQASRTFSIPAGSGWTQVTSSLNLASPDWTVVGSPDLSRTYATSFIVAPQSGSATGSIYLDDFTLREAGGPIDLATAPIATIAERLAERQFSGLWTGRNRTTGLIYNRSDDVNVGAMNTTGGVLWMLPSAVRRGWVSQADADAFAGQVASSLNTNLNEGTNRFLPTRFINPATAGRPGGDNEESTIDASFIALALHHYKSQPTTPPALAAQIDAVQNRFQFDAFATPGAGFSHGYRPSQGISAFTYDGYTNEGKVISLAAEVSDAHHVPLESRWNTDTFRSRNFLVNSDDAHLTHSLSQFRAPFEQALLNLFVDASKRGVDNYPVRSLATNPWENYVRYEREASARLQQLGRNNFFQPDAAFGSATAYEQYSLYNSFGAPTLFMPWSVSLALLAGADGADEALRFLLDNDWLSGPLGIADSARWATGAAAPTNVAAYQDNWNVALSTMALLEYLDGEQSSSRFFASLPGVSAALDEVFLDGDLDGNNVTNAADLAIWQTGFGDSAGATPAGGDADGDGDVDGADFLRWQRGLGGTTAISPSSAAVPEPGASLLAVAGLAGVAFRRRFRPRRSESYFDEKSFESACSRRAAALKSSLVAVCFSSGGQEAGRGPHSHSAYCTCPRRGLGARLPDVALDSPEQSAQTRSTP